MACLLPQPAHDAVAAMRGFCLDLDGDEPIHVHPPNPRPRPITINELLAGWAYAVEGYGLNSVPYPAPFGPRALTLIDIETRKVRLARIEGWQVAVIEGEPATIDLRDRETAQERLSRYAWLRRATT